MICVQTASNKGVQRERGRDRERHIWYFFWLQETYMVLDYIELRFFYIYMVSDIHGPEDRGVQYEDRNILIYV